MNKFLTISVVGLILSLSTSGLVFASSLPDCPSSGYFHNCYGTTINLVGYGYKYVGDFKNGKYHGRGVLTHPRGDNVIGEFKDGKLNGKTNAHYSNGNKYVGGYINNKRNGYGTYTFANGDKYVGEHRNSKFHAEGTIYYADGRIKEGVWNNGDFLYAKKLTPKKPKIINEDPPQDNTKIVSASSGSGFAVSTDGYVITNHHVINACEKVFIHTNGLQIDADVITFDKLNDLALLKADFNPQAVLSLSSKRPELLQDIYVAGYPFGMNISTSVKVTKGIVSSLTGIGNNFSQIQIDAALQGGNSGGPILDDNGNVVGVTVSKLDVKFALKNFGSIPENTNFGIKTSVVASILDSSRVNNPPANEKPINKSELAKIISNGTYYISCWMTMAKIDKMRTKKVMFSDLD